MARHSSFALAAVWLSLLLDRVEANAQARVHVSAGLPPLLGSPASQARTSRQLTSSSSAGSPERLLQDTAVCNEPLNPVGAAGGGGMVSCPLLGFIPYFCGAPGMDDADFKTSGCLECRAHCSHERTGLFVEDALVGLPPETEDIDLADRSLRGSIPANMSDMFPNLRRLTLARNKLTGPIPASLFQMPKLETLDLSNNFLSGVLEGDDASSSFLSINLAGNALTGHIPMFVGKWHHLQTLSLAMNKFSGHLPQAVANWTSIILFTAAFNQLTGEIPSAVGGWQSIVSLFLQNNQLTGEIPAAVGSWANIMTLDLSGNQLTGHLPTAVGGWQSIMNLNLRNNQLTGEMPAAVGNWSNILLLDLRSNQFVGNLNSAAFGLENIMNLLLPKNKLPAVEMPAVEIPAGITLEEALMYLPASQTQIQLSSKSLTGPIPDNLPAKFKSLLVLNLSSNKLEGPIPESLGMLIGLRVLDLSDNQLTGPLPSSVGNWTQLTTFFAKANRLSGPIPQAVGSWANIMTLDLSGNQLTGHLPTAVGSWANIVTLDLSGNQLTGHLPTAVGGWQSIMRVTLWGNQLTGEIPAAVGNWTRALIISLAGNSLSGKIPDAVGSWGLAIQIQLSLNSLSGEIPDAVRGWSSVMNLDLNDNQLTGSIPDAVRSWKKVRAVNLQNNALSGEIPRAVGEWGQAQVIHLFNNRLSGQLPAEIGRWVQVQDVRLANNNFFGKVPQEMAAWSRVLNIDFSSNYFTEFSELGNTLRELNFDRNALTVLPDMGSMSSLKKFTVRANSLVSTGSLPPSLVDLDLSTNQLAELPQALFVQPKLETLLLQSNDIRHWPKKGLLTRKNDWVHFPKAYTCGHALIEDRFHWPALKRLDITNNPMNTNIRDFMSSLSYIHTLVTLQCRNCSLHGALTRERVNGLGDDQESTGDADCNGHVEASAGFRSLNELDLSANKFTEINAQPSPLLSSVDLSSNEHLFAIHHDWFNLYKSNRVIQLFLKGSYQLHIDDVYPGPAKCARSGYLAANPDTFETVGVPGAECTKLCEGPMTQYIHDFTLNVDALCRCQEGFGGAGLTCSKCPEGTYSHIAEHGFSRECLACPIGAHTRTKTTGRMGIGVCACPRGTYIRPEAAICQKCEQFPYRSTKEAGAEQASECGCNADFEGLKEFAGQCGCDEGFFVDHVLSKCRKCSNAEHCQWGTMVNQSTLPPRVKPGFWAEAFSTSQPFGGNDIFRCASQDACLVGGVCAEGREGRACGLCQAGRYGKADGPCLPCPANVSPEAQRWSLAAGVFGVLVPAIILLHFGLTKDPEELGLFLQLRAIRTSMKQTIKHLQNVSVIGGFSVTWPAFARAFFASLDRIAELVKIPTLIPTGCLYEKTSASQEMYAKWATPVIFVICTALAMPISWCVSWAGRKLSWHCPATRLTRRFPAAKDLAMTMQGAAKVLLFATVLFWSTLVANALEMVTCVRSPNGKLTVATYPHLECSAGEPEFFKLSFMAAATMVFYLMVPMLVLFWGYTRSCEQLAATRCARRGWFSFIFDDFRDNHMIWSLAIMVKDFLCVIIPVTMPSRGAFQLLLTAALCTLHAVLIGSSSPFKDRSNSVMEMWNGATTAALCFYSVGMGYENTDGMEDISELFEDGVDDPIYQQRAVGMVVVQVITFTVPAAILLYQFMCSTEFTSRLLPRKLRPMSDEAAKAWVQEVTANIEEMAAIMENFDSTDLQKFRQVLEESTAVIGYRMAKISSSPIVQRAESLREDQETRVDGPRVRVTREMLVEI